jgi:LacI family transcriptional regulator
LVPVKQRNGNNDEIGGSWDKGTRRGQGGNAVTSRRKITLADVAARAGVSATTASYVINGRSAQMRISAAAERRVRKAVADLGYRPNRSARSLRTATTKTIGVISDFLASGLFASQMLTGASAAARESDHLLVIGETEGDPVVEALLIEEMLDRQVDGIIYATVVTATVTVPAMLAQQPIVLLNCVDPSTAFPALLPDEHDGGRSAARLLLSAGLTDGIYVVGEDPTPNAIAGALRLEGARGLLEEEGRLLAGVVPCGWAVVSAYDAVSAWLDEGARPAALICLNDRVAMGTYQALAAHGLDVPLDVSVVSFDGSELATWLRPTLTSVGLPYAELGARAVPTLVDPATAPGVVLLPMPISQGGSVRSPAPARGRSTSASPPDRSPADATAQR